ncbi:neutral ceramidase precursor [Drechmeria coniospora]|uniref:Neutral ceramidase n=1 Tax=Drechmeria coniospora TaxID=98403 RepID=A0A151GCW2_DRECN|nr:neutral ceramidase precursor [Drechmeria coniospora]KYK54940.1 neutral ceramidase precursor [Drechmeria coniospora]
MATATLHHHGIHRLVSIVILLLVALASGTAPGDKYLIGVGKADITGPVVEIGFAGYANSEQVGSGLRQRLHSRAFVVANVRNPKDCFVYLVLDTQSGDTAIRYGVLEGLKALGNDYNVYGHNNLALTGTHSHAGPGGWFNYLLPQFTTLGFSQQSYQAIIAWTPPANMPPFQGYLDVGTTVIKDGAINRSLHSYLANPKAERDRYDATTDTTMTLLRFRRVSDGKNLGVLTWFPVHGTSLLGNNTHAAGDNKGVAAWMLEESLNGDSSAADGFVAGFSQANVGDTSPNVLGAYCDDGSGQECSFQSSTCADGKSQKCHGRGPEFRTLDLGVKSCYEIGRRQFDGAKRIYDSMDASGTAIVGPTVKAFHFFHDMRYWEFTLPNGQKAKTCPAALGYSFAAGTSDWPGAFDFTQGDSGEPKANPIWKLVSGLIKTPSPEQRACHGVKPILLDVGELDLPYAWTPNIVDIQTLRVGQLLIIVSPSEATTMSGRRWKAAVAKEASTFLNKAPIVVLGGPANSYSHYCATPEEYAVQRYEGASTLFGQHQLDAYINLTVSNMHFLRPDSTAVPNQGRLPPDNRKKSVSFIPGVVVDGHPPGSDFGNTVRQPDAWYLLGDVVKVTFQAANPRNNLRLEDTFVAIEQQSSDDTWTRVSDDNDWFLVYTWRRTNWFLGYSEVDVTWETAGRAKPGTYRVRYYGDAKPLIGNISPFQGTSNSFILTDKVGFRNF